MGRVLIVDEEPMLRLLLRLVLENDGHEVRDADDGREALIQIGSWRPDVVVTELEVPGVAGEDLLKRMRMRADSVHMRIVAASTSIPPGVDIDASFAKPYDAQVVAKQIDAMISEPREDAVPAGNGADDAAAQARTAVLSDIWSRLVSVDSHAHDCDPECDAALEEIRRLARWIDDRVGANQRDGLATCPSATRADLPGG